MAKFSPLFLLRGESRGTGEEGESPQHGRCADESRALYRVHSVPFYSSRPSFNIHSLLGEGGLGDGVEGEKLLDGIAKATWVNVIYVNIGLGCINP